MGKGYLFFLFFKLPAIGFCRNHVSCIGACKEFLEFGKITHPKVKRNSTKKSAEIKTFNYSLLNGVL